MACHNSLEVDKILIWHTQLPYPDEPRTSPAFSLMGEKWYFKFVYSDASKYYHCIYLHKLSDGQRNETTEILTMLFSVKTFMMPTNGQYSENCVKYYFNRTEGSIMWWCSSEKEIFNSLTWLHERQDVKFACQFYDLSPFTLRLQMETESLCPSKGEDKSVQVSSEVPRDMESLCSDFSHLLEKEILSDVSLECGDRTFRAHRSVLSARSDVFRAMFQNETLESKSGQVKVQDMEEGSLEKLLKFLYTGRPEDLSEDNASDLYEAADKYAVSSLKTACAYWIKRNLTTENCLRHLMLADSHADGNLKADVISFITKNPSVMKSEDWLALSRERPVLANEVFQTFVASIIQ